MMDDIINIKTPEQEELAVKKVELENLQRELTEEELKLNNIKFELDKFKNEFSKTVGTRYRKLDEIGEKICAFKKEKIINDFFKNYNMNFNQVFEELDIELDKSIIACNEKSDKPKEKSSLKNLYRQIVKEIHPDIILDENKKAIRNDLMIEVNEAYKEKDEEKLKSIICSWKNSPENVEGEGIGAELIRIIRGIYQTREKKEYVIIELEEIKKSEIYGLKELVDKENVRGRNVISNMCCELDSNINKAKKLLNLLSVIKLLSEKSQKKL